LVEPIELELTHSFILSPIWIWMDPSQALHWVIV
jgi:hypothetical protein